ncbi:MAG: hypothetical protein DRR00_29655, partial [Candidatus Parabeggiatoa sp. nov. 3]
PAYPPYEEEICVRKRLLRYFGGGGIEAMGMVGKRGGGEWGRNEFLAARLPTLRRGNLRSEASFALFWGGARD